MKRDDFFEIVCRIGSDKYAHGIACLLIAWLAGRLLLMLGVGMLSLPIGTAISVVCGVAKEVIDSHNPENKFDLKDLLADLIGAVAGGILLL